MPRELDLSGPLLTDDLVATDTERLALERLRSVTGEEYGPMERHGLRCFAICERIAANRGHDIDRELLLVAALVHDIGLYDDASSGGVYVTDGRDYAAEMLAGRDGWDPRRTELCLNAIERHHELRSQWPAGAEVELLRRADLVELSAGLISFGTGRDWRRKLRAAVPRKGTYREIGRMVAKAARERPASLPRILLRGR